VLPPEVQIQIPGRQLQLIRARRGGGKPGIRLCPVARPRRGMVSPSPAPRAPAPASNRGTANQPCPLSQPPSKQLAPWSRRPASASSSTLQAVLREDAAPRPADRGPLLSAPSGSRRGGCCKRALASTAELRGKRPARVWRTERSAERGASLPPPGFPHLSSSSSLPPSLLASSLPPCSAPRPRSRSASHTKFMKVLSARGAERRPIPRAAALSRAAPPPKVFSLRPPPCPSPSKYLPQPPGWSSDPSNGPLRPLRLHRARTRSPAPARSPFVAGGHRERRLEACARSPPPRVLLTSRHPRPISSLASASSSSETRRLFPVQNSSGEPAVPHPASQDIVLLGERYGAVSIRGGPATNSIGKDQHKVQVGYLRLGSLYFLWSTQTPAHPGNSRKMKEAPLSKRVHRGPYGL
jgi:hypothetical protein